MRAGRLRHPARPWYVEDTADPARGEPIDDDDRLRLAAAGIAYLCCKSTHRTPEGEVRSSIWPDLPHGTPVALTGPDLFGTRDGARIFLVTEHGIACIEARPGRLPRPRVTRPV